MKNLEIQIPSMQSSHCQSRINQAITRIGGIIVNQIKPGIADISLQDPALQSEVFAAIEKAGYSISGVNAQQTGSEAEGKTFNFRTDIQCHGCAGHVATALESVEGIGHWDIDLDSKDRVLSVLSEGVTPEEIIKTVQEAGYQIEIINETHKVA
jgi:copper chaperone CopZ